MMKLKGFRITNFRSVDDSGWIDTDKITGLIGTNESGKTNLLIPLWKLNPAKDGELNPMADFPRKRYNEIRSMENKPIFIEALFELPCNLIEKIRALTDASEEGVRFVSVTRNLGGEYGVIFKDEEPIRSIPRDTLKPYLTAAVSEITALSVTSDTEIALKDNMLRAIKAAFGQIDLLDKIDSTALQNVMEILEGVDLSAREEHSTIAPRYEQLNEVISQLHSSVSKPPVSSVEEVRTLVIDHLPPFVYYSNYGNLDSEIYLPHVIDNLKRDDLGSKEEAKVRTLKVLFEFVGLQPVEIHELGKDLSHSGSKPTSEQIQDVSKKKKEREILLQSASAALTDKFRNWWKQGNYRFRLQADGDFFHIWVADDMRPEEIELECRSTGLQWFLSFYLIFLVESCDSHQGAILLLDEPGISLHPLAQQDLSDFFENLASTNQLLYTTHSPFMVDPNHLDRIKAVYIGEDGTTKASPNLRASETRSSQTHSIYPVHAALGLSVSDILLQGCQPVIVEGPSDQFYLNAIKNYLIGNGIIKPKREIVFVPAGGVKGIEAVAAILAGKDELCPYVVLDSDNSGTMLANKLQNSLYKECSGRIILLSNIIGLANAEIEDLIPRDVLSRIVSRLPVFRILDEDFSDIADQSKPIVPQIEAFAAQNRVELPIGWKVDVARSVKTYILSAKGSTAQYDGVVERWESLFTSIDGTSVSDSPED